MGFNVDDAPAPALSRGAVVGIGVGSGVVAVTVIAAVAYLVLRWRRRNRKGGGGDAGVGQGVAYKSGYHAPQDGLAEPVGVKPGVVVAGAEWDGRYGYPVPQGGGYQS